MATLGLVLTGGGARAAYQVGALKSLIGILGAKPNPFPVIAGSSAGAINGASLATGADDLQRAVQLLEDTWMSLSPDSVYRTDVPSLFSIGLRWFGTVSGGGSAGSKAINHLLDTAPLRQLLSERVPVERLAEHFESGDLRALGIATTNYQTGTSITFFDGVPEVEPWIRTNRMGRRAQLTIDHVMASSAIPVFFPPVEIDGTYFGDGSVRLTVPLSPAIHLGADHLIAISVRYYRPPPETQEINQPAANESPSIAQLSGVLLNSVFLDSLDSDVERLERINRTLALIPRDRLGQVPHHLKPIPALILRPSQDLGELASELHTRFPATLRYLLRGIGAGGDRGQDLLSYLAFEREYVQRLIDLGFSDTQARAQEIRSFVGRG